jgi:hypothetical protein
MLRKGLRLWVIPLLLILGIVLGAPLSVQAAKNSGRAIQYMLGHANGEDLDYMLFIEKGDTRKGIIIPQYRLLKGIDGYSVYSLFAEDEFVDKYNKDFIKERKGYKLEAVAADNTIVQITNQKLGSYLAKGLKEGQTVIRFYETYLGVRHYLGCRLACVGKGDMTEETVTIFVGSRIVAPSTWNSARNYAEIDGFKDGTNRRPNPKDKSLFKKVNESKYYSYYQAVKTGETTATVSILNVKKSFKVKIIEPSISKKAKKEYSIYEGYSMYLWENFNLFDTEINYDNVEGVSSNSEVVEVKYGKYGLGLVTKKTGTANVKLYFKMNNESKYLGEITIQVLQNNDPAFINSQVNQPSTNANTSGGINDQKKPSSTVIEKEKNDISLSEKSVQMRVGDSAQCWSETNNDPELKWKVSNTSLASINSSTGVFTAKKTGAVTVTAYTTESVETIQITIVEKNAIIISGKTLISGEEQLEYTADFENVKWSLSDSSMALMNEVDGKLILHPIRTGTFTLYADTDTSHGELTITNKEITFDEE